MPLRTILLIAGIVATLLPALGDDLQESAAQMRDAGLERLFWDCDFAATRVVMDAATGAACATATDELLRREFRGDFKKFVNWWRVNKKIQHAARAEAPVANAGAR